MAHWPLHPQPDNWELLAAYVRRLAEVYGVRYETFCLRALGIPRTDRVALGLEQPSSEVLERLSVGTGVPVERLRAMTMAHVWGWALEQARRLVATPEGQAALARWEERLSLNS